MPSFCMRQRRVFGCTDGRAAAPADPAMRKPVRLSASGCAAVARPRASLRSRNRERERGASGIAALKGASDSTPRGKDGASHTNADRCIACSSSRTLPGQEYGRIWYVSPAAKPTPNSRASRTRRSFPCSASGSSLTSSRKGVPRRELQPRAVTRGDSSLVGEFGARAAVSGVGGL